MRVTQHATRQLTLRGESVSRSLTRRLPCPPLLPPLARLLLPPLVHAVTCLIWSVEATVRMKRWMWQPLTRKWKRSSHLEAGQTRRLLVMLLLPTSTTTTMMMMREKKKKRSVLVASLCS